MVKEKLTKEESRLLERVGTIVTTASGNKYAHIPFWFKQNEGVYEICYFGEDLPGELVDAINKNKNTMNRPSTNTLFLWTKGQKLDLHQKVEAMTEYHNLLEYITELEDTLKSKFAVSKRQLLESILEDMDGKHPEYHREVVEDYLDDGC